MVFFIKLSLWALAFVPLILAESVFFPFIFGKVVMIRIFVALASLLFAVHLVTHTGFRNEIYDKLKRLIKNPLFIALSAFITLSAVSTIFAANPFRAFFGDVERGEGMIGLLYFYGFFVYSLLLFEKKDWIWFFRLNLLTGAALFTKALMEMSEGAVRPGSFTGNPAFLGGYFLFVVFAALASFYHSKKDPIWRFFSAAMMPIGVIGLLLTQTRSAMVGLVVGALALLVYGAVQGESIAVRRGLSLRKACLGLLGVMVVFGGIFFTTKSNPVWQSVPGVSRVAQFTLADATVQTRLISFGVSKNAIDPEKNGMQRFLIGWGPENFSIAYNKYYNPDYYRYEHTWFDRAHNKLMDVAVMNGILGLLAYIGMWVSVAWLVFRRKGFSFDMMTTLFFGTAFFFNLLFVFDQVSTIIPLFAFFAFLAYLSTLDEPQQERAVKKEKVATSVGVRTHAASAVFGVSGLFFLWALVFWTIVPFSQMSTYLSAIGDKNAAGILANPDAIFEPYTFAQQDIRGHFLNVLTQYYGKQPQLDPLIDESIRRIEELIEREPSNPRYLLMIANAYDRKGRAGYGEEFFKKAEVYYNRAAELAPMRQDVLYATAFNLSFQGRVDEAIAVLRTVLTVDDVSPETHYFLGAILTEKGGDYREALKEMEIAMSSPAYINFKDDQTINIYSLFLKRTYAARDKENFLIAAKRLEYVDPSQVEQLKQMEALVEKGQWPVINFR